jgi:threonine dehydrogenase-like Zn-dependent dehydrogenase
VIIGDGKLAQAIIRVIAQTGCEPTVIGKHEHKLELASSAGARCLQITGSGSDPAGLVDKLNQPDVVIEASGSPTGLPLALSLVRPGGVIVLKSTHHAETALALSQVVVNEITIVGSRCGRLSSAVELLASGKVDMRQLISAQFQLDEGLKAFEVAARPDTMKVLLRVAP